MFPVWPLCHLASKLSIIVVLFLGQLRLGGLDCRVMGFSLPTAGSLGQRCYGDWVLHGPVFSFVFWGYRSSSL